MKWFTKSKALRKQKIKVRKAPASTSAPKPKYQKTKQPERGPKIVQPHVEVPFIGASLERQALIQDSSLLQLESLRHDTNITSVEWNLSGGACAKCQAAQQSGPWNSVGEFLDNRPIAVSPNGKPVGIYGYSHPECSCNITIFYADGNTATVTP